MKKIICLCLTAVLLAACGAPSASSVSGVQAWLDQPVPGSILPLGVFLLKAHARHVDGSGITRIEFLVNGVAVGAVDTDAAAPLVYGEVNWNASAPGEYLLTARAYAGGEFSDSTPVRVCVSQEVSEPVLSQTGGCDTPEAPAAPAESGPTEALPPDKATEIAILTLTAVPPTTTPTFTSAPPTVTPTFTFVPPTVTPPPTFTVTPVPPTDTPMPPTDTPVPVDTQGPDIKNLYHSAPGYYGSCDGTFTMQALGVSDPSGIASVIFGYRYEGVYTSVYYVLPGTFIGNSSYELTIDNNSNNQAYDALQGGSGYIRWYVQVYDNAGNVTTIGDQVASIYYCIG